jgi:hypothetical protein
VKTLGSINLLLLGLISLLAGISKILQLPVEAAMGQSKSLASPFLIAYGVVYLLGGALLVFRKTRMAGAITLSAMFSISAFYVFTAGKIGYGLLSVVPILMAVAVMAELWDPNYLPPDIHAD